MPQGVDRYEYSGNGNPKIPLHRYDGNKNTLEQLTIEDYQLNRSHPEREIKTLPSGYKDVDIRITEIKNCEEFERLRNVKDAYILFHGDIVKKIGFLEPSEDESGYTIRVQWDQKNKALRSAVNAVSGFPSQEESAGCDFMLSDESGEILAIPKEPDGKILKDIPVNENDHPAVYVQIAERIRYAAKVSTSTKRRLLITDEALTCFEYAEGGEKKSSVTGKCKEGAKISLSHFYKVGGKELFQIRSDLKKKQDLDLTVRSAIDGGEKGDDSDFFGEKAYNKITKLLKNKGVECDSYDACTKSLHWPPEYSPLGIVIEEDNSIRFIRQVYGCSPQLQSLLVSRGAIDPPAASVIDTKSSTAATGIEPFVSIEPQPALGADQIDNGAVESVQRQPLSVSSPLQERATCFLNEYDKQPPTSLQRLARDEGLNRLYRTLLKPEERASLVEACLGVPERAWNSLNRRLPITNSMENKRAKLAKAIRIYTSNVDKQLRVDRLVKAKENQQRSPGR